MESKGRLSDISRDWNTGKFRLTFTVDADIGAEIDKLTDRDLRIKAVQWREKRSLDANSYYWVLVTKIAEKIGSSNTEIHNEMLADYGQVERIDEKFVTIILLDSIEWKQLEYIHLRPTTATKILDDGKLYRVYYVMRGSHTYDSKEMSRLIDGAVWECKELGIETLPPDEIERIVSLWHGKAS